MDLTASTRAATLLSAVSAPQRVAILSAVVSRGESSLATIADDLAISLKALLKDVVHLQDVGLVSLDGQAISADLSILREAGDALVAGLPIMRLLDDDQNDLARFFRHGRLATFPEDAGTQEQIAALVVQLLPTDRELTETEVNEILGQVHDDHATLRRLLVDYQLVTRRASSGYRRIS